MKGIGVLAVAVLAVALLGGPAAASCAAPPPLAKAVREAPVAFVGTVVETSNEDRWAIVSVAEVWAGEVHAEVEVRGGPADPPGPLQAASSVDRSYRDGATYLFVPSSGEGDVFYDDACSSTTRFGREVERLRPRDAASLGPFEASPRREGGSLAPVSVAAAVLAIAVAAGLVLWRRARSGP